MPGAGHGGGLHSPTDVDKAKAKAGVDRAEGKSIGNAATLLAAFVALLLASYAARKTLPLVFAKLQSWRHRRSLNDSSGAAEHMRLPQSEAEAERERGLELGLPSGDDDDDSM